MAEGHLAAIKHLTAGTHVYNLMTGKGFVDIKLLYRKERRPGESAIYADISIAELELEGKAID